jgi:hypothetical protein
MPGRARHPEGGTASGALGNDDDLTRLKRRSAQPVLVLKPPNPLSRIAAVMGGRDRPKRVTWTDAVRTSGPGALGASREHAPGENGDEKSDEENASEHVFAMLANACSVCQDGNVTSSGRMCPESSSKTSIE